MFSQTKSELELLREEVQYLREENTRLTRITDSLNDHRLNTEYLTQQMMLDKLRDNWDMLRLEDIEAICKI